MAHDHVELVGKVVRVANALQTEPIGLFLEELSSRTGFAKSSLHRILHSLSRHGYIEQDGPGGRYRLGLQFLILANGLASRMELVKMGRPFLHELVERFRESAYLAVMRGHRGVFVDVEEAPGDLRLVGPIGAEVHFHSTAAGKAMAAFFPEQARAAILSESEPLALTPHTVTQPASIEKDWARVRKRGYAVNDEETIVGAYFLAGPVFDSRDRVCASVSVGSPKGRLEPTKAKQIAVDVKDACRRLSEHLKAMGYVHLTGSYDDRPENSFPMEG